MSIVKMYFYFYFYCPFLFSFVRVHSYNIFKITSAIFPIFFEKICVYSGNTNWNIYFPFYFFPTTFSMLHHRHERAYILLKTSRPIATRGLITKVFKQINRPCFLHLSLSLSPSCTCCDPVLCTYDDDLALRVERRNGSRDCRNCSSAKFGPTRDEITVSIINRNYRIIIRGKYSA